MTPHARPCSFTHRLLRRLVGWLGCLACCGLLMGASSEPSSGKPQIQRYAVAMLPGLSLAAALTQATPVKRGGQMFHAYTVWRVDWNYRWRREVDGRCRVVDVDAQLHSTVTLPELMDSDESTRATFESYVSALREHELGHVRFGQDAAREIEEQVMQLAEANSCEQLAEAAGQLGDRIVRRYRDLERQYDLTTQHGRSQGAWLMRP